MTAIVLLIAFPYVGVLVAGVASIWMEGGG